MEPGFGRAGLGVPVVVPAHERRKAHENRFGAAAGLQAEERAAIPDEVEFDVTTAAVELKLALAIGVGRGFAPFDDWQISGKKRIAHGAEEGERMVEAELVEIVEEQSADAARFVAVFQEKVVVAVFLEARIECVAERRDRVVGGAMPVDGIFFETVVRGEIETAAEPPGRGGG